VADLNLFREIFRSMKINTFVMFAVLATAASALDDSPSNRQQQAARYMEVTPPKALIADMAEQVAKTMPPDQRESFKATLTKNLDTEAVTKVISDAMTKHFTADELKAMADFYGSDVGRSVMKKFGAYMAEAMPALQGEMGKAMAKTNRELPDHTKK
jgi:hypothetical protein